ncbi:MAG: hypothetical protein ACRDK7_02860 [Solirubrobacteraceae bacterium]
MTTLLPTVRTQLLDAAERRSRSPRARLLSRVPGMRLSSRRRRAPLICLGVVLVLVGGAFGAGVIQLGSPAKLPFSALGGPREGYGALVPGTVRLLPIAAPDPAGGPDWGMRELSTTRGEGCLQLGRVVDGKLGALGEDYAFHDDGRFHELPVSGDENACAALDAKGRLFTNVTADDRPASAWIGTGHALGGCVPATASPAEKDLRLTARERKQGLRPVPICRQDDLRNIYYGLLGPDAKSVTYVLEGQRHTLNTVGNQGAYLFVTRASAQQLLNFANAGTADVVPVDGPVKEIHYRDGSTCHLTRKSWIGGAYACTPSIKVPVGYIAPQALSYTHQQARTPLQVKLIRTRHGRYELHLAIRSRVALTSAETGYDFIWSVPGAHHENHGDRQTESNIAAGQTVSTTTCPLPPGVIHGTVSLHEPNETYKNKREVVYAYKYEKRGVLVASFTARIPGTPSHANPESRPTINPETKRPESPFSSCSAPMPKPHG